MWEKSDNIDFGHICHGSELLKAVAPSIFVLSKTGRPLLNFKTFSFLNYTSLRGLSQLEKCPELQTWEKSDNLYFWHICHGSEIWKAVAPSILVLPETVGPFWNSQTYSFLKHASLRVLSQSEKCPELQTWEKSKNLDFDELSRLGTERVNGVRRKKFFVLKRVFFDQATSKNNFWKNYFPVRGRLTRSLPSYFPKIIDFHSKFSKLWNALTPSILIAQESYRPFWNRQTQIFQKQLYFDILSPQEKCPELQTWEKSENLLY